MKLQDMFDEKTWLIYLPKPNKVIKMCITEKWAKETES